MSRHYTFDDTTNNITVNDVVTVINNLINAEKIVVGRSFNPNDYTIVLGYRIGAIVSHSPETIKYYGIIWRISPNVLPTGVVLSRVSNLADYTSRIISNNGQIKRNKKDVALVMSLANKQDLIKDVIFNNPATIVYWVDGTKTVVKAHNEKFDPEKGLAMAICKRFLGSNKSGSNFNNIFKKWLPEQKESNSDTNIKDYEKNLMASFGVPPQVFYQQERLPEQKESNSNIRIEDDNKNEPLRWMTVAEVAEELGCSKALVQEECRKGLYPGAFKENGKWLIPVPLLEEKRGNKNE